MVKNNQYTDIYEKLYLLAYMPLILAQWSIGDSFHMRLCYKPYMNIKM